MGGDVSWPYYIFPVIRWILSRVNDERGVLDGKGVTYSPHRSRWIVINCRQYISAIQSSWRAGMAHQRYAISSQNRMYVSDQPLRGAGGLTYPDRLSLLCFRTSYCSLTNILKSNSLTDSSSHSIKNPSANTKTISSCPSLFIPPSSSLNDAVQSSCSCSEIGTATSSFRASCE